MRVFHTFVSTVLGTLLLAAAPAHALNAPGHYQILQNKKVVGEIFIEDNEDGTLTEHRVLSSKYKINKKFPATVVKAKSLDSADEFFELAEKIFDSNARYLVGTFDVMEELPTPDDELPDDELPPKE